LDGVINVTGRRARDEGQRLKELSAAGSTGLALDSVTAGRGRNWDPAHLNLIRRGG
jgi:hypothetical protein